MSETDGTRTVAVRELVAEEIRVLLARRKLSASELARRIGATQPYMSRRLTGDIAFDVDDLAKIAAVLNVEVVDLLPASREGRTVVTVGEPARRTTVPKVGPSGWTSPIGHSRALAPRQSTRRPVVLAPSRN